MGVEGSWGGDLENELFGRFEVSSGFENMPSLPGIRDVSDLGVNSGFVGSCASGLLIFKASLGSAGSSSFASLGFEPSPFCKGLSDF